MKRGFLFLVVSMCFGISVLFAGGGGQASSGGRTHIVFWYGLGGQLGQEVVNLVERFNQSQNKVTVEAQFQGSYEESINKLRTAMRTRSGPDIVQIYEGGTRLMIESGFIVPAYRLVDEYKINVGSLEPNILA